MCAAATIIAPLACSPTLLLYVAAAALFIYYFVFLYSSSSSLGLIIVNDDDTHFVCDSTIGLLHYTLSTIIVQWNVKCVC